MHATTLRIGLLFRKELKLSLNNIIEVKASFIYLLIFFSRCVLRVHISKVPVNILSEAQGTEVKLKQHNGGQSSGNTFPKFILILSLRRKV